MLKPRFDMFYLTFLLPDAKELLEDFGFNVQIHRRFPKLETIEISGRYAVVRFIMEVRGGSQEVWSGPPLVGRPTV